MDKDPDSQAHDGGRLNSNRQDNRNGSHESRRHRGGGDVVRSAHDRSRSRNRSKYSRSRSRSYTPMKHRSSKRRSVTRSQSPGEVRRRLIENPRKCRCLGVFGLNIYTSKDKIVQIFEKFGPLERCQVVIDAKSGRSRGYCFVYFERTDDARVAKEQCNRMEIDSRTIRVDYSITQRAHTPTPGVYKGRTSHIERDYYQSQRNSNGHEDHYYRERRSSRDRRSRSHHSRERRRRHDRSYSRSPYSSRERRY